MDDLASDTSSTATMDYTESAGRVADMLGEDLIGKQSDPVESPGLPQSRPETGTSSTAPIEQTTTTYEVPKSWKKEMHAHWGKVSPEAQAYIIEREKQLLDGFSTFRPVQDAITPYMDWLQRSNVQPAQAVRALFEAQMRLTQGPIEARREALAQLQRNLGLADEAAQAQAAQPIDPALKSMQDKLSLLEQHLQSQQAAQIQQISEANKKLVGEFAADTKAHPYFDEVADEMAIFIKQGASLQDAYEKAVRVNEAVWAKEQARLLTEAEAKWKENARLASLPKKRAASVNIKSDRDGPEPTEPLGSIEDTIKRVHKDIRGRA